jgi:hypothetical protein
MSFLAPLRRRDMVRARIQVMGDGVEAVKQELAAGSALAKFASGATSTRTRLSWALRWLG